jgi:kumamolisin
MRTFVRRFASLSLVAGLAACSGGGSSPVGSGVGAPTLVNPPSQSSGFQEAIRYGAETTKGATPLATAPSSTVAFGVFMRMRNPLGLMAYAAQANDPKSATYRHWLTPQQIADQYGATQSDYAKVAAYFRGKGLAVASWSQREMLFVHGSRTAAEAALGAHFGTYTKNGVTFVALQSAPAALSGLPIAALPGVSTYGAAKRVRQFLKASGTPTFGGGYSPQQIASAFDYTGAYHAGYTGKGITIGIIGTGPITAADYTNFRGIYGFAGQSTVTQVNVTDAGTAGTPNGYGGAQPAGTFTAPPPTTIGQCNVPPTGPDSTCNPEDGEAQLDTEQTFSLARDASVLFYIGYAPAGTAGNPGSVNLEGLDLYPYEMQQAINDDKADVLSLSFGAGELDDVGDDFNVTGNTVDFTTSPGPMQFASLAAEGIAVFASSGDDGNLQCIQDGSPNSGSLCVAYPAVDPNVVAVGGVTSPIGVNGRFTGPLTVWGAQTGNFDPAAGASSGGVSAFFPKPTFQSGVAGVVGSTRNVPDISLVADLQTGVATLFNDLSLEPIGGTSVAAPQSAAMWALVLQGCVASPSTCKGVGTGSHAYRLGGPNSLYYPAYADATTYASTFYDVTFGDNSQVPCTVYGSGLPYPPCANPNATPTPVAGYSAGVGYDRATGIGVPFGRASVKAFAGI